MKKWLLAITALTMWSTASVSGQEPSPAPFVWNLVKDVAVDPTTYAPAIIMYGAMRLDWESSQVFFQRGYVEQNERYTASGVSNSAAIGQRAGHWRIARDSASVLSLSVVHNAAAHMIERGFTRRYPTHRKLFRVVGRIERIAVASYLSMALSGAHFRQWRKNEQLARQLGYK
jgi:hypothetical protein